MSTTADRAERIVVADDVELHVLHWDGGGGTPFVLVHGLSSNARLWDGVAPHLAAAGHTVVALDLRGHGRSAKPDSGYDVGTVATDLRAAVDALGLDRPVLVGQSWGGNVVVECAARFPRIARAVAGVDGGAIDLAHRFPTWDACVEALRPPPIAGMRAEAFERAIRDAHPDWPDTGVEGTLANLEHRGDGTVAPWLTPERHLLVLRGLWEHRPDERLRHVTVPVLLLVADGSDVRAVQRAASQAPAARAERLAGDHDLHAQHPGEVSARLRTLAT